MNSPTRIFDLLRTQLSKSPRPDAFAHKVNGEWKRFSTAESLEIIEALAWGLHLAGIEKGDRVANVTERNRPEWNFIDNAVTSLGAVHVPVYPNLNPEEFELVLNHSEAKLLFVSSEALVHFFTGIRYRLRFLEGIYTYDPVKGVRSWSELRDLGEADLQEGDNHEVLEAAMAQVDPNDLATLIYTSGTMGAPKAVMLSHANLISNCIACCPMVRRLNVDRTLSFLPLCHVFERTMVNIYVGLGISVYYVESFSKVVETLREVQPVYFAAVPRVLEKIYEAMVASGSRLSGIRRKIFDWAHRLALEYRHHGAISWTKRIEYALADRLVFRGWRQELGDRLKAITCGSAPLPAPLASVFFAAGVQVFEGYGLTEAAPVISTNYDDVGKLRVGTVGPIIPGGQVKLAVDGEILYRGPNVMMGYFRAPDLTNEAIDKDGWLHTGDIGQLIDGFLTITGRKNAMFKTSGGKYVHPQQLENKMKESPFIEQILVVGEGRKHPAALIVPAFNEMANHLSPRRYSSRRELIADPKVQALIQQEVDRLNQNFGRYLQVKKFLLVADDWTVDTGELTATLKLKRRCVTEKYANEIESLYAESAPVKVAGGW